MKLRTRVLIIITASLLGLVAMGAFGLFSMRQSMMEERRSQITQLLDFADAQLKYFHGLEVSGKLSREEAQSRAKESIAAQRKGSDYFFIRTLTDDFFVYHPVASRMGKADPGEKMKDGRMNAAAYREDLAKSKDNKAFMTIYAARPNSADKTSLPKLVGVVKFEPWGWMPGIGFYTDDIDSRFWKQSVLFLLVGGVLLSLLAVLVLRMRAVILRQLGGEPQDAAECMKKIASGDLGIEIEVDKNDNSSLMASLKLMQMKLTNLTSAIQENALTLADQVTNFDDVAKSYAETRSEEEFSTLQRSVKKLGKTADILGKSISRFRL